MIDVNLTVPRAAIILARDASQQRLDRVALAASARGARGLLNRTRAEMEAQGLGRLGFALGAGSDQASGNGIFQRGPMRSASGWMHVRSGSPRSRGAIESYTVGANITPRNGRYLWILSEQFQQKFSGGGTRNQRLEPRFWQQSGLEARFGPLFQVTGDNGLPVLVIRDATISASGRSRSARPRTKTGKVPKGQVAQDIIPVFFGIKHTARSQRVNLIALAEQQRELMRSDIIRTLAGDVI